MLKSFALACLGMVQAQQQLRNPHAGHSEVNGFNALTVKVDGQDKTLYLTPQCGTGGASIDCGYNARATLSESPSLDPNGFFRPNLLNGSVEYDVDLSQTNCGCVAAFYTVALPAIGSNGQPHNTDGYYYCDANNITGEWCPEFDIMEAN